MSKAARRNLQPSGHLLQRGSRTLCALPEVWSDDPSTALSVHGLPGSLRPTCSSSRPARWAWAPPSAQCSKTPWPASQRPAPGAFGWVVGVDRVGQAAALHDHGGRQCRRRTMIETCVFSVKPWAVADPTLRLLLGSFSCSTRPRKSCAGAQN